MKEYNPNVIDYVKEQIPDIVEAYEEAVLSGGEEGYVQYLSGIIQAYEHLVEKFGA